MIDTYKKWNLVGKIKFYLLIFVFISNILFPIDSASFEIFTPIILFIFIFILVPIIIKINTFLFNFKFKKIDWNALPFKFNNFISDLYFYSILFFVGGLSLTLNTIIYFMKLNNFGFALISIGLALYILSMSYSKKLKEK